MEADKLTTELCKMLQLFFEEGRMQQYYSGQCESQDHILQLLFPKVTNSENLKY